MTVLAVPKVLRERLGDEATDAFVRFINEAGIDTRKELASKEDVTRLREELRKVESNLKENSFKQGAALKDDMNKMGTALKDDMNKMGAALKDDMNKMGAALKDDMNKMGVALKDDMHQQVVGLVEAVNNLNNNIIKLEGKLTNCHWMMGTLIAIVILVLSLVMKTFFK
ncbi:MAG: DUF1640 domain-containing protein [Nitrospirae bacterium]|nr:DUF1640 domain-containing protein [Nitrospirota bacterium]